MTRLSTARLLVAGATLALGAASVAHARTDVVLSIGVPLGYVQPAPVYVQPQPVYVQPQPVYYVQPQAVYVQPQPVYYYYGHERRHGRHHGWRDADRDGVPNRYDRAPHNPYRY